MSKARGEGAQRAEPLALLGHRIENLDALGHHLEYGIAERRIGSKHPPKGLVGQREHPGIGQRPPRGQERLTQEKRYLRKELAGAVSVHNHFATVHPLAPPELSFEDHRQVIDGLTFSPTDLAGGYEHLRTRLENLPQLLVGQPLEERHLAQVFKCRHGEPQRSRAPHISICAPKGDSTRCALNISITFYFSCVELLVRMMPSTEDQCHPRYGHVI